MQIEMKCTKCNNEATHPNGRCKTHYAEYWIDRWHPKNGVEGLRRYLLECFPKHFDPAYSMPEHQLVATEVIFDALTNGKSIHENLIALYIFREGGKTTTVIGITTYAVAFNLIDYVSYRGLSHRKTISDFMDRLKPMFREDLFVEVFGELIPSTRTIKRGGGKNQESEVVFNNELNSKVKGLGLEQSNLGAVSRKKRIGLALWDDLESVDNVKTPESRQQTFEKVFGEDIPACDVTKSVGVYIGTPKHKDGMFYKIKNHPKFKKIEFWLYKKDENGNFLYDEQGARIPQWPEKFPLERCLQIESTYAGDPELGVPLFNREYLGILENDEEKSIRKEWIQYRQCEYKHEIGQNWCLIKSQNGEPTFDRLYRPVHSVLAIDPATSMEGRACNTGGVTLDTLPNGERIVREYFHGKYQDRDVLIDPSRIGYYEIELDRSNIQTPGIIGETFRCIIKNRPNVLVIENVTAYESLVKQIEEIKRRWFGLKFPHIHFQVERYTPGRSDDEKIDRILAALRGFFEYRMMYLNGEFRDLRDDNGKIIATVKPMPELFSELTNLSSGMKVDIADALQMAARYSKPPKEETLEAKKKKAWEEKHESVEPDMVVDFHESFL